MAIAEQVRPFPGDEALPTASVVIACRNERDHIRRCLASLLDGGYPLDRLELLVVDGGSSDGTREVVTSLAAAHPEVRLVDNPRRVTPAAFNEGIRAAGGEVIAIVGAHAEYGPGYLRELVRHLIAYDADEAGAVASYVPRRDTMTGRALAACHRHRFGAGVNVGYKVGSGQPTWVDTVSSGVYRASTLASLDGFNEHLTFSQDLDLNRRLRRAAGRILLVPGARIVYHARSDVTSFLRHQFRNGAWNIIPHAYIEESMLSWRHLVPMAFVGMLVGSMVLAALFPMARPVLATLAISYLLANVAATVHAAWTERRPEFLVTLPLTYLMLHLTYGLGSWWGVLTLPGHLRTHRRSMTPKSPAHP